MGELLVHMFATADGVMQAPGEPDEDREGGFEHGGWQYPYLDEEAGAAIRDHYEGLEAILLGRKTYDIFARYWPTASADNPFTALLNEAPKYVASRARPEVTWQNSAPLGPDVPAEVARLKEQRRRIDVIGSGDLLQTLLAHQLVDRMHLWVHPVVLGTGKRVFGPGTVPTALKLVASRAFATGVVLLTYERAGRPTYGDIGADV